MVGRAAVRSMASTLKKWGGGRSIVHLRILMETAELGLASGKLSSKKREQGEQCTKILCFLLPKILLVIYGIFRGFQALTHNFL